MTFKMDIHEEYYAIQQVGNRTLMVTLKGFLKITHLMAFNDILDVFMKSNQMDKLLVDQSGLKALTKEVQTHLAETILVIAGKELKKVAIVEAKDFFAKRAFDKLDKEVQTEGKVTRAFFDSQKKALEWLLPEPAK